MMPIAKPLEPWALDDESRRLCLLSKRSLSHKLRVTVGGQQFTVLKRDRFVAISDQQIADPDKVLVTRHVSPRGYYVHQVRTNWAWKPVFEHATTGAYAIGGRGRRFGLELTLQPTPPIMSVMRVKIPAQLELIERPQVPVPRLARQARELTTQPVEAEPGRHSDPKSESERRLHSSELAFIGRADLDG